MTIWHGTDTRVLSSHTHAHAYINFLIICYLCLIVIYLLSRWYVKKRKNKFTHVHYPFLSLTRVFFFKIHSSPEPRFISHSYSQLFTFFLTRFSCTLHSIDVQSAARQFISLLLLFLISRCCCCFVFFCHFFCRFNMFFVNFLVFSCFRNIFLFALFI